jgi:2-amino-4-hydroxy-6-hydroxymethyldihydropteridine diphosphokinase
MTEETMSELVFIGLGSNMGDPAENLRSAIKRMDCSPDINVISNSSFYRSTPVGITDQPDFVNAVCKVSSSVGPESLLKILLSIEVDFGRVRSVRNGPRILDLDILLFGDIRYSSCDVVIPHPRMFDRAFVLKPLLEIAPDLLERKSFNSAFSKDLLQDDSASKI